MSNVNQPAAGGDGKTEYQKLKESPFKQQTMKVWRPELTPVCGLITFALYTIVFFVFGAILKSSSDSVVDFDVRYDNKEVCAKNQKNCEVTFTLKEEHKMVKPVYFYYQLDNFYQNQRDYVKSRDYTQQSGRYRTVEQIGTSCSPIVQNKDLFEWQQITWRCQEDPTCESDFTKALETSKLKKDDPATPCGLVAKSLFTDVFSKEGHEFKKSDGTIVPIKETGIAWATDLEYKFNNIQAPFTREGETEETTGEDAWKDIQWTDMKNEHFVVWMRYAGLPTFRKLWGIIEEDMEPGEYTMQIDNLYDVEPFEGQKRIVFSTTNSLGGKSYKLAICFFIAGAFTALYFFFLLFKIYQSKQGPQAN